jgi:hypothetical protein
VRKKDNIDSIKESEMDEMLVLKQTMHLGHIKESFSAGTVIAYDPVTRSLKIDGKVYENSKDIPILKNHGWVEPYVDQSTIDEYASQTPPEQDENIEYEPVNFSGMRVIQSDADLMEEGIDIRYTKAKDLGRERKTKADKDQPLPVIRGDESPEERQTKVAVTEAKPAQKKRGRPRKNTVKT